jgi:hypothetical protein
MEVTLTVTAGRLFRIRIIGDVPFQREAGHCIAPVETAIVDVLVIVGGTPTFAGIVAVIWVN